jgi:hypothetical protein
MHNNCFNCVQNARCIRATLSGKANHLRFASLRAHI